MQLQTYLFSYTTINQFPYGGIMKYLPLLFILTSTLLHSSDVNENFLKAVQLNDLEKIKSALASKADINTSTSAGNTALLIACRNRIAYRKIDIIEFLLSKNINVNAVDNNGVSALNISARYGDAETAKLLIDKKADIDLADNIGTTPLMISIYFSKNSVAVILIENGADVNKPSKNGFTPLMAASSTGNTEMVKLLLEKNADPSAKDNGGLDAAYLASKDEIRALLKSAIKKTKKK